MLAKILKRKNTSDDCWASQPKIDQAAGDFVFRTCLDLYKNNNAYLCENLSIYKYCVCLGQCWRKS